MPGKKKKTENDSKIYSKDESFENLKAVQDMALNKRGKYDDIEPDISLFLKAEELKGKLCGLYSDKTAQTPKINIMGSVKINGSVLLPKTGEDCEQNDTNNDRTARNFGYSGETDSGDNGNK